MNSIEFRSHSPEETRELATALGKMLTGGEVLLLHGPLGSGKTCFTQGLAKGLEVADNTPVVSPTFVLHLRYEGRLTLDHIDAYRLEGAGDIGALGFDEMFSDHGVTVVEWAEILGEEMPPERLDITFSLEGETERLINFASHPDNNEPYVSFITALGGRR